MRLSYEKMKNYLDQRYQYIEGNSKGLYFNELGQVVATMDKKTINTFYKEDRKETINPNLFIVSIIKNLYVGKEEDKKVIDAMYIRQVCGEQNDVKVDKNFAVNICHNTQLDNELGAIGMITRSIDKKSCVTSHFINEEFDISVSGEEYQKSNAFTFYGVYLVNLKTKYSTKKLSYDDVSAYYNKTIERLKLAKEVAEELARNDQSMFVSELPLKYATEYIEKRMHQSYDGLIHPEISATNLEVAEEVRKQFIPTIDKQEIIYKNVKKKVI